MRRLLLLLLLSTDIHAQNADTTAYQSALQRLLDDPSAVAGLHHPQQVRQFYREHGFPYLWQAPQREALLTAMVDAERYDGLPKARYHYATLSGAHSHTLEHELLFTDAFFRLALDLANGFLDPKRTHRTWNAETVPESALPELLSSAMRLGVHEQLHGLNANNPRYQALRLLHHELQHADVQTLLQKKRINRELVAINLERQRWLPQSLGHEYVLVNIPSYRVQVFAGDTMLFDDKVMIGKTHKPTPAFVDQMQHVVMSPAWYPPPSLRKGGRSYVPPGRNNPMGRVKFLFPNQHSIYLHDTPKQHLFQNQQRTFSAGCVRVHNAEGLANVLLRHHSDWQDPQKIHSAMNKRHETWANIEPVPIYLTYWTLWGDAENRIYQAADVYGKDQALMQQYRQATGQTPPPTTRKKKRR